VPWKNVICRTTKQLASALPLCREIACPRHLSSDLFSDTTTTMVSTTILPFKERRGEERKEHAGYSPRASILSKVHTYVLYETISHALHNAQCTTSLSLSLFLLTKETYKENTSKKKKPSAAPSIHPPSIHLQETEKTSCTICRYVCV
jgi:hypothetical protein